MTSQQDPTGTSGNPGSFPFLRARGPGYPVPPATAGPDLCWTRGQDIKVVLALPPRPAAPRETPGQGRPDEGPAAASPGTPPPAHEDIDQIRGKDVAGAAPVGDRPDTPSPAHGDTDQGRIPDRDVTRELAARDQPDTASPAAAGCLADTLPAGPGLAAWLAEHDLASASDHDAVAMAAAYRRVASWAQAGELAAVAQVAARSAARHPDAGLGPDGRPAFLTRDAAAQVSLELVMSRVGAEAWAELALDLAWRLPDTAAALAEGRIDLIRARIVAEAVAPLSDEAACAVEDRILPGAGDWTYTQLRNAARRAVIAVDPDGAEHRRQAAERRAKVSLYADQDCTATLSGTRLPAAQAAAAMARVSAMAQALKAAGAGGGLHLLRAQVYLGLLLGTLPLIPPPAGGPPDTGPPDTGPPDTGPPDTGPPDTGPPEDHSYDGTPPGEDPDDSTPPGSAPEDGGPPPGYDPSEEGPPRDSRGDGTTSPGRGLPPGSDHGCGPPGSDLPPAGPWTDAPPLTDADLPRDEGWRDMPQPVPRGYADQEPDRGDPADHELYADPGIIWPWPGAPLSVGPWLGPPGPAPPGLTKQGVPGAAPADPGTQSAGRPPPGGLIDLTLPWATLTGTGQAAGTLGRIGPVTAPQARALARMGTISPATQWRVILTDPDGAAVAVARVPRPRIGTRPGPGQPPGDQPGRLPLAGTATTGFAPTIGRVTVVMPATAPDAAAVDSAQPGGGPSVPGGPLVPRELPVPADLARACAQVTAAARRARDTARRQADADQHAPGGCAHTTASPAYRPPPRLRELITARDQTCRNPRCGQPAWRGDLDHTRPYHLGGLTCSCNLGGFCRGDHQLKQLPGWTVTQPRPGTFTWTSPAGRTYTTRPDPHHTS